MVRFDRVHAFGYNSAMSEPIWVKSEVHSLSGAGPGRFCVRSFCSDSWRARGNFVFVSVR